jgi:hypothetical protein
MSDEDGEILRRRFNFAEEDLSFLYEGLVAGVFEGPDRPSTGGRYRYLPVRSGGHYLLHCALQSGQHPRCTFKALPDISFAVFAWVEYGMLELSDFTVPDAGPVGS